MVRPVTVLLALFMMSPEAHAVPDECDVNGAFDLAEPTADADILFEGNARGQTLGRSILNMDLNNDGHEDLIIGVPNGRANGPSTGRVEVRYGPLDDLSGAQTSSSADAVFIGSDSGVGAGHSLANAGDIDGDGYDDLLIGSNAGPRSPFPNGVVWVMYGGNNVVGAIDLEFADATIEGSEPGSYFGRSLVGLDDFDDDGDADFAIGAPAAGNGAGAVHLVTSPPLGLTDIDTLGTARFDGTPSSVLGEAMHAADIDQDGLTDLLLGAPKDATNGTRAGAVYMFTGDPGWSGPIDVAASADAILLGEPAARAGTAIGSGDIDGDGYPDVYVGSPLWGASKRGVVDIVRGGPSLWGPTMIVDVREARIKGVNAYDAFGSTIAAGRDLDGDGRSDVIIGAIRADSPTQIQTGAAWVITEELSGDTTAQTATGARWGGNRSSLTGAAVALFDDLNGDGIGDFAIGGYQARSSTGIIRAGQVAMFWGGLDLADNNEWYADDDGDGWGSSTSFFACGQPADAVAVSGDCNDANDAIYPYANELTCGDAVDYNCDGHVGAVDNDGDGTTACGGDCDDGDASVGPHAVEVCGDDIDNDCDQAIDDGTAVDALLWAADVDGDGDGDASLSVMACEDPGVFLTGYAHVAGDCDDANGSVNQFAVEICDNIDNNCVDGVDEASATDAGLWYPDLDDDGYGSAAGAVRACVEPAGFMASAGDCDDTDGAVRPGAEEFCNALDDDCDTQYYSGGQEFLDQAEIRVTAGEPGESLGRAMAVLADWNQDGRDELVLGAPAHDSLALNAGAVYLRWGWEAEGDVDLAALHQGGRTEWDVRIRAERAHSRFGEAITTGDINGDGVADLVIGAPGQARPQVEQGAVFVFYGPLQGDLTTADADVWFSGIAGGDEFGSSLLVGDLDDDGFADLLIGSPDEDGAGDRIGAAHLLYGGVTWESGTINADATLVGSDDRSDFGMSAAGGDFNGDGLVDLVVGASRQSALESGAVHLVLGTGARLSGEISADQVFTGPGAGDRVGISLAGVGDVNQDGVDDLLVGSAGNEAYLLTGGVWTSGDVRAMARTRFEGTGRFGNAVAAAGDVNLDGVDDLLFSAAENDTFANNAGAAVLIYGGAGMPSVLTPDDLAHRGQPVTAGQASPAELLGIDQWEGAVFYGQTANAREGRFLAGGGDINGDGVPDLLIGSHLSNGGAGGASAVYGSGYGLDMRGPDRASWSMPLQVDGERSDWSDQVQLPTTADDAIAVTWDEEFVYFGVNAGVVGAGGSLHVFMLYFGDGESPGSTEGRAFGIQQASLPFPAHRYLTWRADNSYNSWDVYDGTQFVRSEGWFGGGSAQLVEDDLQSTMELAIPRSELGDPSVLQVAGMWYFDVPTAEMTFSGIPSDTFVDSADADLTTYLEFDLGRTAAPARYTSLPGDGLSSIEDHYDTYFADLDGDGFEAPAIGACPLHVPAQGYSTVSSGVGGDCDDRSASAYPGAADSFGDGIDQNCDGADGVPPVVTACDIAAGTVRTNGTVTALGTATADNTPVTMSYVWSRNGTVIDGETSDTLTGGHFSKGDDITVECIATDAVDATDSMPSADTKTIANTPPSPYICRAGQNPSHTADVTGYGGANDADGDPISWVVTWNVNGITVPHTTFPLPTSYTSPGDSVSLSCRPFDGENIGGLAFGNSVTVRNAAPTQPEVSVPVSSFEDEPIVCQLATASTDADGDPITYQFQWSGDYAGPFDTTHYPGDTIPAAAAVEGSSFTCTATASDPYISGAPSDPVDTQVRGPAETTNLMAANERNTCVILDGGDVNCWGNGGEGVLGQGDTASIGSNQGELGSLAPIDLGAPEARQIALGERHACAVFVDGSLKCWGANDMGQLGLGNTIARGAAPNQMGSDLPFVDVGPGRTVHQVEAAGDHTCARLDDGGVKCWGAGLSGALGHGATSNLGDSVATTGADLPYVDLGTGRTAIDIAVGEKHSCALLDTAEVKCWGDGTDGRTGHDNTVTTGTDPSHMGDNLPVSNLGGAPIVDIVAGGAHTCAINTLDNVYCMGRGAEGQLGTGFTYNIGDGAISAPQPVFLGLSQTVVALTAGHAHTCARFDDGAVKCWGGNDLGQLGVGHGAPIGDTPTELGDTLQAATWHNDVEAVDVVAGRGHTCVVDACGKLHCWGNNANGQLGVGDTQYRGDEPREMGDALPQVVLPAGRFANLDTEGFNWAECTNPWSETIMVDGSLAEWSQASNVSTTGTGNFHITWDDTYLYLAARTPAADMANDFLLIYLSNATDRSLFNPAQSAMSVGLPVSPTVPPLLAVEAQSLIIVHGPVAQHMLSASSWTYFTDVTMERDLVAHNVEMAIPLADIGLYANEVLYLQATWESAAGGFGAVPWDTFDDYTDPPDFGSYLRMELDHSWGPANRSIHEAGEADL